MRAAPLVPFVLSLFAGSLFAQQPPAPAVLTTPPPNAAQAEASPPAAAAAPVRDEVTTKVVALLRDTALGGTTAFTEERLWGYSSRAPKRPPLTSTGVFDSDHLHVTVAGDEPCERIAHGRRQIARKGDGAWQRLGRTVRWLPAQMADPSLFLQALADQLTAIVERSHGERDGVMVESYTAILARPQIDALSESGVVLDPIPEITQLRRRAARALPLPTDLPPDEVDVRIDVDAKSRRVVCVFLRAVAKPFDPLTALAGARQRAAAGGGAPAPAAEPVEPATPAAYRFQDGLPVRVTDGMDVHRLELRLHDHGRATLPPCDEQAQRLLGR